LEPRELYSLPVLICGVAAIIFAAWLARDVLSRDSGTPAMQDIANRIYIGAVAFLRRQQFLTYPLVEVRLFADAFCWQMVRGIVGHLLLVGDGRRDPASTAAVLAAADRSRAGNIAPAHGLVLEAVTYPSLRQ
jgi:tRNA U38,U39,U40 pseudouridine synthase TruA